MGNFWPCIALPPGNHFVLQMVIPCTRQLLSSTVQSLLRSAGDMSSYFQIGTATTAASQGLLDYLIRTSGLWFSDTYLLYLHFSQLSQLGFYQWCRQAFAIVLLFGLGASGLGPWGLSLSGHEPPSPVCSSPEAFGSAGGARGWVAGRAGFWGAYAPGFGVSSSSPQVPGHPTSTCNAGIK